MDMPRAATAKGDTKADSRGEQTRERILDSAVEMFAECGYEGCSTRQMAARAGVNQPAIQYHFDSKEGLYHAVVGRIADRFTGTLAPLKTRVAELVERDDPPAADLRAALLSALDAFMDMVLTNAHEQEGQFIARAEVENADALDALGNSIAHSLVLPCASLIGRLIGKPAAHKEVLVRTLAILGQVLNFKNRCVGRAVRRSIGWAEDRDMPMTTIRRIIHAQTLAIIDAAVTEARA